ncbi:MAG: hypothetical protein ACLTER_00230 [Ruminococcus sp.]
MEINLGIDFGGSGSGHSFTATAITRGFQMVIPLASEWISCKDESGNPIEIDPDMLGKMFCNFCQKILSRYGFIDSGLCGQCRADADCRYKNQLKEERSWLDQSRECVEN